MFNNGAPMKFPSIEVFKSYITDECGNTFTSSLKSTYVFLSEYFERRPLDKNGIREMVADLKRGYAGKEPLAATTIRKYIQTAKIVIEFMELPNIGKFSGPRIEDTGTMGDLLSDSEMEKLCTMRLYRKNTSSTNEDVINLQYEARFVAMRFLGITPEELANIEWSQDKVTHFQDVRRSKNGKKRNIPIVPPLRDMLDSLPRYAHNKVFGSRQGAIKGASINAELRRRADALGIKKRVTCYSFRYSMVTACYINATEASLPKLATITGHTVDTAIKHYAKYNVEILYDALMTSHPGLRGSSDIDTIKRVFIDMIQKTIDKSKYEVELNIRPKQDNLRHVVLS